MNEELRQFALGVAGVRLWYARSPLPGAAPSPEYDFGEEGGAEIEGAESVTELARTASSPPQRTPSAASRQGLARLQGLLAEDGSRRVRETKGNEPPAVSSSEAVASPPPAVPDVEETAQAVEVSSAGSMLAGKAVSLHWRFWHGGRWLLVSSSPDEAGYGLEDRLATNILKALGDTVERTETLRWPVFSNPAVPGNDAAGAVEVLGALAKDVQVSRQLWLGLEPDNPESGDAVLWRSLLAPLGEAAVSFPNSLAALSSDPASKRRLWRSLQSVEAG